MHQNLLSLVGVPGLSGCIHHGEKTTFGQVETRLHTYISTPTGLFANAYILEAERGVIVVEGTLTAPDGKRLLAQMDALNDVNNSFRVRRQKVCAVRRFPGRR